MAAMANTSSPPAPGAEAAAAAAAAAAADARPRPPSSLPVPNPNPLPLSASQEAQVRDIYYERVRRQCQEEIKAFAECALGRTFSVVFACRDKNTAMNGCLKAHATPRALDEAREEWFARRAERAAERVRKAARKAEQEKLLRAWWGLEGGAGAGTDANGNGNGNGEEWMDIQAKRRRREEEKLRLPERMGGLPAKDRPRFGDDGGKEGR